MQVFPETENAHPTGRRRRKNRETVTLQNAWYRPARLEIIPGAVKCRRIQSAAPEVPEGQKHQSRAVDAVIVAATGSPWNPYEVPERGSRTSRLAGIEGNPPKFASFPYPLQVEIVLSHVAPAPEYPHSDPLNIQGHSVQ